MNELNFGAEPGPTVPLSAGAPVTAGSTKAPNRVLGDAELRAAINSEYATIALDARWSGSGTLGVKNSGLNVSEATVAIISIRQIVGPDGNPIADFAKSYNPPVKHADGSESYPGVPGHTHPRLVGDAAGSLAGAHVRATMLLGEVDGGRTAATVPDLVADSDGNVLVAIVAGTHVEEVRLRIDITQNPINPWFLPTVTMPSLTFVPAKDRDDSGRQVPYLLGSLGDIDHEHRAFIVESLAERQADARTHRPVYIGPRVLQKASKMPHRVWGATLLRPGHGIDLTAIPHVVTPRFESMGGRPEADP
jgi:hypothetical protein